MNPPAGGSNLQSLTCTHCGAAIPLTGERFVVCPYCSQVYNMSDMQGPRRGELLLWANFLDPNVPGWKLYHKDHLQVGAGGRSQIVGRFEKQADTAWVIESSGSFDNIDASVTINFLEVEDITKHCRLGFAMRWTEEGRYCVDIAPKGNYCVGKYEQAKEEGKRWKMLVDYATHPAMRIGANVPNHLRVVNYNDHIRVYINNVLVSSVRDPRFTYGTMGLVLENTTSDVVFAISDLELRETINQ
jgi:hypothetical protein